MSAADTILQALTQHHHREPHPRTAAVETLADYDAVRGGRLRDFAPVFTTSDGSDVPATELRNSVCGCLIQGVGPHTLLNLAELAEKHECQGASATPDFFKPGRTYAREHHASTIRFLVRYIDDSPEGIPYRVAFGWKTEDGDVCASPFDSDDFSGWADVTEGGAVDA